MRIAFLPYRSVARGGKRVAECIAALFPEPELFTLLATQTGPASTFVERKLHTSFLQKLPFARTHHRSFLLLCPWGIESLDLRGFDLVLSLDSGRIKHSSLGAHR